jgi:hypothetical protein
MKLDFKIGNEKLILNALLTYVGLWCIKKRD